jgi:hypothetical protein
MEVIRHVAVGNNFKLGLPASAQYLRPDRIDSILLCE